MTAADATGGRVAALSEQLASAELDVLMIDEELDLRWLSGYTGSNGLALVAATGASARLPGGRPQFLTDFRYVEQAATEVDPQFERTTVTGELRDAVPGMLGAGGGRLGFDGSKLTVKGHARLRELLPEAWELVDAGSPVEQLRLVKDAGELERLRAAAALADEALVAVLERGLAGRTEREVAFDLEMKMRSLGAEELSFPSIVASGAHGALPHAQPRDVTIPRDVLVTIDWGARLDGYCSDCTRTYATGEGVSARAREVYALVLEAQLAGLDAVQAGPRGREVDAVAREIIDRAGYGEHFGHGLGHGVGLAVHEAPRLSRTGGEEPLRAGSVVTVEPGVYLPGELGVRIEDLTVVRDGGCEVLTSLPKDLTVV